MNPAGPEQTLSVPAQNATSAPGPRAGRNLPAAIGVGLGLGAVILLSLLIQKQIFLVVVTAAVLVGVWELVRGLEQAHIHAPLVPCLLGGAVMLPAAYFGGSQGLFICAALALVAILLWRAVDETDGAVGDIAGGAFVTAYVPVLAAFTALLLAEPDGVHRIIAYVIVVVCSDVGGYAVGVLFGRHPMAPSVSPKKSWEGFAGSLVACAVGGVLVSTLLLGGAWWAGLLLGLFTVVAATMGDLGESTVKRDLGIKDLGNILPGHGGIMDRLDSLLLAAPVAWIVLAQLVPIRY